MRNNAEVCACHGLSALMIIKTETHFLKANYAIYVAYNSVLNVGWGSQKVLQHVKLAVIAVSVDDLAL